MPQYGRRRETVLPLLLSHSHLVWFIFSCLSVSPALILRGKGTSCTAGSSRQQQQEKGRKAKTKSSCKRIRRVGGGDCGTHCSLHDQLRRTAARDAAQDVAKSRRRLPQPEQRRVIAPSPATGATGAAKAQMVINSGPDKR